MKDNADEFRKHPFNSISLNTTTHIITIGFGAETMQLHGNASVSAGTNWGRRLKALADSQNQNLTILGWTYTNSLYPLGEAASNALDTFNSAKSTYRSALHNNNNGTMKLTDVDNIGTTPDAWHPWMRNGYIKFTGIDPSANPSIPYPPSGIVLASGNNVTSEGQIIISSDGTENGEQSFDFRLCKCEGPNLVSRYGNHNGNVTIGTAPMDISGNYTTWAEALDAIANNNSPDQGLVYSLLEGGGGGPDPAAIAAALAAVNQARIDYNTAVSAEKLLSDGITQDKITYLSDINTTGSPLINLSGEAITKPYPTPINSQQVKENAQWRHNILNQIVFNNLTDTVKSTVAELGLTTKWHLNDADEITIYPAGATIPEQANVPSLNLDNKLHLYQHKVTL